jgi:hypothetical protein
MWIVGNRIINLKRKGKEREVCQQEEKVFIYTTTLPQSRSANQANIPTLITMLCNNTL